MAKGTNLMFVEKNKKKRISPLVFFDFLKQKKMRNASFYLRKIIVSFNEDLPLKLRGNT